MSQDIAPHGQSESARVAEVAERRWAVVAVVIIVAMAVLAAVAGVHRATMPQAIVETINPVTLHLGGEFVESNLGSAIEPDGTVTVRAIGQQYSFTPQCMVVPAATRINFRATSPDVVHGFLIEGTTINTMLVPGYVATISARFDKPGDHLMPCQEFCGVGHEGMWAKVKVLDKAEFLKLSASKSRLTCVE